MTTATNRRTVALKDPVARELRRIYRTHGNRLHPADVVEVARDPDNPLHSKFVWDDTKAAEEYRLWQARQLIARVRITIPASSLENRTIRAYQSLRSDESGYRHMREIVDAPELMESLIAQFASDLERLTDRYDSIRKTSRARKVFEVIEEFCKGRTGT